MTSDSRFLSRKFQLAAYILVLAAPVLLYLELITADHWVDVTKWVFGLYCTGNVAAGAATAVAKQVVKEKG